jgi:hypothetical protein
MISFNTYLFSLALCTGIRFSWFLLLRRASSILCLLLFLQLFLFPMHFLQLVRQFLDFFLQQLITFLLFVANPSASVLALEAAPAQVLQEQLAEQLLEEELPALQPLSQ